MTTEIEKIFFNTFNIEPIGCNDNKNCTGALDCTQCPNAKYPQITDRILLELICIIHQASLELYGEEYYFESVNYKELKEEVIAKCKRLADKNAFSEVTGEHIKHQVRTLFEEG